MNFRQIKRALDELYDEFTDSDDKASSLPSEMFIPLIGDEWVIQRNYPDGESYEFPDEDTPWANGEPREEMMDYIEVIALAVVQ